MNEAVRNIDGATKLDAAIIGAGVAGLYQIYQLRNMGMKVRAFEAASDVGGTWYWNRYPGARFDSEAYIYQYLFSEDLYKGWSWSERFPGQPEIERWMHYVTDSLDLRKDIQFDARIVSAHYNEDTRRWIIRTEDGETIDAQFLITCCGMLSAPLSELFPGQSSFKGRIFHTARWPHEPIELEGKKVGVIGIGATGIQVIQTIASKVGELTVFVRTPQYVLPMKNPKFGEADVKAYKERFDELKNTLPHTFTGFEYDFMYKWADLTPARRRDVMEEIYQNGSLKLWLASFAEMFFDPEVSEEISEFVRDKMRARLKDPKLCDLLIPKDYGFGTHRVPLETNYLEVYHRPNVKAVSVKDNPIVEIVPEGLKLADGTVHELDMIVMATGFDAGSGALTRIDIRGRGGHTLKEDWGKDIRTAYGMQVHGYPNLFMTGAPLAPSAALCNMTTCLQQQTEWIADCIRYMRDKGVAVIEPTAEVEERWVRHHDETANANLISKTNSWYVGSNVPGKPRRVLSYTGGVGTYRQKCNEVAESGYEGFAMTA
ncbi:NAD(P)/FAD-dependent oxidoreductase [Rhodoblastus acidophilus]|uniref:flavin-containing monooxygenase n=1 Tax=Candidatus Rhodoblastus alkanivorans TaxID=2954117 RepID=UPI001FA949D8|nr:NAD(P)/FAD-dependent oxidoreductase [Candidatus Rhodoblastus alkanivorans]MCI4680362.1 NAD(P)/FAD-dependent oxidoreductase [Candidatus Rhodoblastus alkanivorans]MDI4639686.1 NAD(P)/FAD-dependent oxidoreductase [Rhodoblastus acidophilus]